MIIHCKSDEPFCERVNYSHETGVVSNTAEVRSTILWIYRIHENLQECLQNKKMHECSQAIAPAQQL